MARLSGPRSRTCKRWWLLGYQFHISYEENVCSSARKILGNWFLSIWRFFSVFRSRMLLLEFNTPSSSWPSGWHSEGEGTTQLDASVPLFIRCDAFTVPGCCWQDKLPEVTFEGAGDNKGLCGWAQNGSYLVSVSLITLFHEALCDDIIIYIDINDIISLFVRQNRMIFYSFISYYLLHLFVLFSCPL